MLYPLDPLFTPAIVTVDKSVFIYGTIYSTVAIKKPPFYFNYFIGVLPIPFYKMT